VRLKEPSGSKLLVDLELLDNEESCIGAAFGRANFNNDRCHRFLLGNDAFNCV
jgi:hypothetical protein